MAAIDLWDALAIGSWYEQHAWAIDGLLYLVLFVGIAKATLGRRFEGRGGAAVVVSVGCALAIGMATIAYQTGFRLASLGRPAWLILLTLLGMLLFDIARSAGMPVLPAIACSTLLIFVTSLSVARPLTSWLIDGALLGVFQLIVLFAVLALAWWLVQSFGPRMRRAGMGAESPRRSGGKYRDRNGSDAIDNTLAVHDIERSLLRLLQDLYELVSAHGIDARSHRLLQNITQRERLLHRCYRILLRQLARSGLKSDARFHLPVKFRELLTSAKDNLSEFDRNLEVASIAHRAGNVQLFVQAIQRLIMLEQQAKRLTEMLYQTLQHRRERVRH